MPYLSWPGFVHLMEYLVRHGSFKLQAGIQHPSFKLEYSTQASSWNTAPKFQAAIQQEKPPPHGA
jgi:hypothetical protein